MMSTDYNFQDYGIPGDVALAHFDSKVGHGAEQSIVIRAHRFTTDVMIIPRLLVVARRCAEGAHYAIEVVPVLQADVILDQSKPCRIPPCFSDRHGAVFPSSTRLCSDSHGGASAHKPAANDGMRARLGGVHF